MLNVTASFCVKLLRAVCNRLPSIVPYMGKLVKRILFALRAVLRSWKMKVGTYEGTRPLLRPVPGTTSPQVTWRDVTWRQNSCSHSCNPDSNAFSLQRLQDGAVGETGASVTSRAAPVSKSACACVLVRRSPTRPFALVCALGRVSKRGNATLTTVQVCGL